MTTGANACRGAANPSILAFLLAFALLPAAAQPASPTVRLTVDAKGELPGFRIEDAPQYLSAQMTAAGVAGWTFSPDRAAALPPDRIEWNFQLSSFAGGNVRQFFPIPGLQKLFGNRHLVTVEERLYLGGDYQTMVFGQIVIQGGAGDNELAAAIARLTQNLLGPSGAYRAIDMQASPAGAAP